METWEHRRKGELTSEYLGRVLEDYLNLPEMAKRARQGHFDDYFAPGEVADGWEIHRLVHELGSKADMLAKHAYHRRKILSVRDAAIHGEFDGTSEEAARWMASKDGQEAMKDFPPELREKLFGDT